MSDGDLQRLVDEAAVTALMRAFGRALDTKDWEAYGNTFAEDAWFEVMGQRRFGREEIVAGPERDLSRFGRLQHFLTNIDVQLDGDSARMRAYLMGIHVDDAGQPSHHADLGGCYFGECVRGSDRRWRFAGLKLETWWTAGAEFRIEPQPDSASF